MAVVVRASAAVNASASSAALGKRSIILPENEQAALKWQENNSMTTSAGRQAVRFSCRLAARLPCAAIRLP